MLPAFTSAFFLCLTNRTGDWPPTGSMSSHLMLFIITTLCDVSIQIWFYVFVAAFSLIVVVELNRSSFS